MLFTCDQCTHTQSMMNSIEKDILQSARDTDCCEKFLFKKCIEKKCRYHKENMDVVYSALGINKNEVD